LAFHPDITRSDDVSLALDAANSAVRIASRQLTGNAGTVEIPNADGTSTIMGVGAGGSGIAPWVGDTAAPGVPLGLSAESHNGAVWVTWDGTLDGGIPADFDHVQFIAVDGSQTVDMGQLKAAGKVTAAELTAGDTVTITAIAYDDAHDANGNSTPNASVVSDPVTVVVQSAVEASAVQQAQDDAQDAINKASQAVDTSNTALTAAQAAQNDTVTNYVPQYAQNSDPNVPPTTGWSNTAPTWVAGTYIWVRTIVSYGSGDYDTTDPVLVTGNTGSPGLKGDKGDPGANGTSVTVKGTVSTASELPSTASDGDGYITADDGHLHVWGSGSFTDVGQFKGDDGTPAYFHTAWSDSADGSTNFSTSDAGTRTYMGTYSDGTSADSTDPTAYTWVKVQGNPGDDGIGVSSITPYYALASSAPAKPAIATPPAPWSITEPAYSATLNLYTTQKVLYSSGAFAYTDVQLSSVYSYAKAAKTTADGKNKIIPSATQPSSTGLVQGDLWFQLDSNKNVVGIQVWNGSSFADYLLLANEILVAGSVGTTQIKDGAVTTDQVTASEALLNKLLVREIQADEIDVGSLAAAIIISNLFQTASSGARVVMNSAGITAYDASGNVTFRVNSADGTVQAVGGFATAPSGSRIELKSVTVENPATGGNMLTGGLISYDDTEDPNDSIIWQLFGVSAQSGTSFISDLWLGSPQQAEFNVHRESGISHTSLYGDFINIRSSAAASDENGGVYIDGKRYGYDTGWVDIRSQMTGLPSGASYKTMYARVIDGMCTISGRIEGISANQGNPYGAGTIPAAYRPASDSPIIGGAANPGGGAFLSPSGAINCRNLYPGSITWTEFSIGPYPLT
jgi:hypothetical protein